MPTVQAITTLNIDGKTLNVSDLSEKVQQFVLIYNEWNQKLADAQTTFALTQAALNDLSRQIITQIKTDQDAAEAADDKPSDTTTTQDVVATLDTVQTAKE
jgi:hypothetical protein